MIGGTRNLASLSRSAIALTLALAGAFGCDRSQVVGIFDAGLQASDSDASADTMSRETATSSDASDDGPRDAAASKREDGAADAADAVDAMTAEVATVGAVVACGEECTLAGFKCVGDLCDDGVRSWSTMGGDIHHTGFARYETGKPPLTMAWTAVLHGSFLSPALSDGNGVYVSSAGYTAETTFVASVNQANGKLNWLHTFDAVGGLGYPSLDHGHLYVGQCSGGGTVSSLSAATGEVIWHQAIDCQNEGYWPPLVVGAAAYFDAGAFGGMSGRQTSDGTELFWEQLPQVDHWSALFLDGEVYTFLGDYLKGFDPTTGAQRFSTGLGEDYQAGALQAPVSDGERIYVIEEQRLVAYRPGALNPDWSIAGAYSCVPSVAAGTVYAISGDQLRANDATSGQVLWTFPSDTALEGQPIVAGRWVYAAGADAVYAVDTSTQELVWRSAPGGWLSMANGQLYVSQNDGQLVAYDLTP
jgi:hypothetical protein